MTTTCTIETARLRLVPPALSDLEDSAAMWGDPDVARFIGGVPATPSEVWARLHRYAGHWALLEFGYWTVRERASGRFVGEVGLADFRRGLGPEFDLYPECGWALHPQGQGRGCATEAILASLDWARENLGSQRVVCMIHPENAPSLRVADKCGFRRFAETEFKGAPTILFEHALTQS